ncbi:hypothetical protein [Methylophaga thiooxydans]|nr:hypothetical protein [Methylophaga thiooxydans]
MSHRILPCSCQGITKLLDKKKARLFRDGLFNCIEAWQLYTWMYGRYRYPTNTPLEHTCSSYADNARAVIGDLHYQPYPCGYPFGLTAVMQARLSPWMECMQCHVWNMACPGDIVTSFN